MSGRMLGSLVVLLALTTAACGGPAGAGEARAQLRAGDPRAAEAAAAEGLERAPRSRALWRLRIRAAMEAGDFAAAADHYHAYRDLRGTEDLRALADMARITVAQALEVPSSAIRTHAVQLAERHEIEALASRVIALLGDPEPKVAAAAAVAVLRAHPQAPEVAARMLQSRDPRARALAVEGIARKAGQSSRPELWPLLEDPEPEVRQAAIRAIAAWSGSADTEALLGLAGADPAPSVRAAALRALGDGRRPGTAAVAGRALESDEPATRRAAVAALTSVGDLRGLKRATRSHDLVVALRAGAALWRLGLDDQDGVGRALRDGEAELRVAALAEVARSVKGREGLRVAGWMLPDPDPEVRLAAGRALMLLGVPQRGRFELEAALYGDRDDLRAIAAGELVKRGDPRGVATLEQLARHEELAIRRRVVRQHLIAERPSAALATALADANPELRLLAADAILTLAR